MESIDISIKWPFKWCLVGTSGSGKTNFSLNIVKNSTRIFDAIPSRLIVIYREFQHIYNRFQEFLPTQLINEADVDIDDINKENKENKKNPSQSLNSNDFKNTYNNEEKRTT